MKECLNGNSYQLNGIEQYENLIAAIPGGIVVTAADNDFTLLFANQGYYDMVGYERDEHLRIFCNSGVATLHPDEAQAATAAARAQMAKTGAFSVKAKLCHKTKGYIWVHFNGKLSTTDDDAKIYIVLVDISEHMNTLEKLEREKSFNEMVSEFSEEAFFDCDLLSGTMRYSKFFADKLGMSDVSSDYIAAFQQLGLLTIEGDGVPKGEALPALMGGLEKELRFTGSDGGDVWYLCRCSVLHNAVGKPARIVGKLNDITRHKEQIDELSHLAQRDPLTGLYNKAATEDRIKEVLKMRRLHDDSCALMIIDIDNFKSINDRLGHLYGDAVLTQLAERLKLLFRADDVLGRVGGDEFFVFLKNYRTIHVLTSKAKEICGLFHKTYSESSTFVTISASIGIALCPENGMDFGDLYRKADAALYEAKATGKNTFSFYTDELTQSYISERTEIDANTMKKSFQDNRIEYVFRLLYNSENPVASIQSVLQLVTESYGFSRGYIFETSIDGQFTSNTFEWCSQEVTVEIGNLQNLPIGTVASANESFLKTGMFIPKSVREMPEAERAVLEPQGILSMFQFGILDMDKLVGFIGFDNCISEGIPTDAEIDEICTVCHVLATFLLKHRGAERVVRHHEAVEVVMDHINSYAYVIDPNTFSVLYENQKLANIAGQSSIGKKCYVAYRSSKEPCAHCPATRLTAESDRQVTEIRDAAGGYLRTEATRIHWSDDKKAILLCGVDISEYKSVKIPDACELEG